MVIPFYLFHYGYSEECVNFPVGHEPCVWLPTLSDKEKLSVDYKKLEIAFQTAKSEMVEEVIIIFLV